MSLNLGQNLFNLNCTEMTASTEEEDPRILVTSYMMYKVGELFS